MRGFFLPEIRHHFDLQGEKDETFFMKLPALRPNVTVFGGCGIVFIFAKVYCKPGRFT
ncbi:hypothetical protein C4K40_4652 [Pseudomonas sp. CMR5c]|nr:hypothetical protein C4K40_4652 [Pseudomonas sp. CMR5c]